MIFKRNMKSRQVDLPTDLTKQRYRRAADIPKQAQATANFQRGCGARVSAKVMRKL